MQVSCVRTLDPNALGQAGCKTQGAWACVMPHSTNLGQASFLAISFLGLEKNVRPKLITTPAATTTTIDLPFKSNLYFFP